MEEALPLYSIYSMGRSHRQTVGKAPANGSQKKDTVKSYSLVYGTGYTEVGARATTFLNICTEGTDGIIGLRVISHFLFI